MVEEKEGQGESETTSEKTEPTVEELGKQITELQETSQKMEDNWKKQEVVSSRKEQTIQQLREQVSSNESQSDMNKVLVAMIADRRNQPTEELTEEIKANQPDLKKQWEQIVETSDKKRQLDRLANQVKTVQERADSIGVKGEEYDIIRAFTEAGHFDKANKRLDNLEGQTKPAEEKKETEDDRVERLANDKATAILKGKGLLTQYTGSPSSGGKIYTRESLKNMSVEEYREHSKEIDEAYLQGRIK